MKRLIALLAAVLLLAVAIPFSAAAQADTAGISYVRVKLSTGDVKSLSIDVTGTYRLQETGDLFTGGKLKMEGDGKNVTVSHSAVGELYTGRNVHIERINLARTEGSLRFRVNGYTRSYLGHLTVTASGSQLTVVNRVPLSHYLYGVVGHEMSNSFPVEALKAQAIAAKNYVLPRIGTGSTYDIGDTSSDQVYKGYTPSYTNVIEAVDGTMNDMLLLNGAIMPCYYAASNGGYINKPSDNWSGGKQYDAGYSTGYDDYDMKNPSTPRETLFVPTAFTEKNVGNKALYALIMGALNAKLAEGNTIPTGYVFDKLVSIENVVSVDENGKMAGLDHHAAVFTALIAVKPDPSLPTPTPTVEPSPTPTAEPTAEPTVEPTAEPTVAPTAEIVITPDPIMPLDASVITPAPSAEPTVPSIITPEPLITDGLPTAAPTPTVEVTLAATIGESTEMPVVFTVPFADMLVEGLFEKTNLRICYAKPADGGFALIHARYGHGVGMSQRGAQQMASEGRTYREIIAYYYGGATLAAYPYTLPENMTGAIITPTPNTGIVTPEPIITPTPNTGIVTPAPSAEPTVPSIVTPTPVPVTPTPSAGIVTPAPSSEPTVTPSAEPIITAGPTAAPTPIPLAGSVPARISGSNIALRKSASSRATRIAKLANNTLLTVSGLSGDWYAVRVEATGQSGYVHSDSVILTAEAAIARAYVNGSGVNLRASNTTKSTSFGKLSRSTELTVFALEKGWYRVRVDATGQMGYIRKDYVTVMSPLATPPAPLATAAPTPTPEGSDAPDAGNFMAYGQINAVKVNFRTGPSTSTASMGKLDKPTRLGIYEKVGSWYRVRLLSEGKDGYVYAKYVTLTGAGGDEGTNIGSAYLNATAVNIRKGPSTRYTSYGRLARNTALTVLGSDGSWYRVRVNETGQEGYVFAKYVTITGIETGGETAKTGRGIVNTGILVLRDKPTSDGSAKSVASVRMGYTVTVHSISGEWAYVTYNGVKGYCIARCIDMK